jgi:thiamine biosynthesis protein ThiS
MQAVSHGAVVREAVRRQPRSGQLRAPEFSPHSRLQSAKADFVYLLQRIYSPVRRIERKTGMTIESAVSTIEVRINGSARRVPEGLDVAALLGHLQLHPGMVVVEHNGTILRREGLEGAAVAEGDELELVHFVGGG